MVGDLAAEDNTQSNQNGDGSSSGKQIAARLGCVLIRVGSAKTIAAIGNSVSSSDLNENCDFESDVEGNMVQLNVGKNKSTLALSTTITQVIW